MTSLLKSLLLLTVFLTPLLGAYKGLGYEQIKVLFFILSISLISFLWMFKKPKFKWTPISKASGIFILALLIASFTGVDPKISLFGTQPYFQGWILYLYLFLFSYLVSQLEVKLEQWAKVLTGSALVVSILAISQWVLLNIFHTSTPTYAGRVVSSFGQPNFYAGFLLLSLPFSYFLFKTGNKRLSYFGFGSCLMSIVGIFVSYSRSSIVLALLLFILGLLGELKIKLKVWLSILGVLLISIFIALKFSSGLIGTEFTKPVITNYSDQTKFSVEKRIYIWPQIVQIALQKITFGYGLENIDEAFSNYFLVNKHKLFEENVKVSPILISLKDVNLDRTHSYILDLLMFSGILGLVPWLILVFFLIKKLLRAAIKPENTTLILGLITYLIWIQFQNQSIVQLIYFWFLVGLIDRE